MAKSQSTPLTTKEAAPYLHLQKAEWKLLVNKAIEPIFPLLAPGGKDCNKSLETINCNYHGEQNALTDKTHTG